MRRRECLDIQWTKVPLPAAGAATQLVPVSNIGAAASSSNQKRKPPKTLRLLRVSPGLGKAIGLLRRITKRHSRAPQIPQQGTALPWEAPLVSVRFSCCDQGLKVRRLFRNCGQLLRPTSETGE